MAVQPQDEPLGRNRDFLTLLISRAGPGVQPCRCAPLGVAGSVEQTPIVEPALPIPDGLEQ